MPAAGTSTHPKERARSCRANNEQLLPVVAAYVVAILLGLALPNAAVVVYFALALYLVWPFRGFHRSRASGSQF